MPSEPARKKVLQIIDSLYRGGAQKVVLEIVRALPEFDHVVCYLSDETDLEAEFKIHHVKLVRLPFHGMISLRSTYNALQDILQNEHVDIIHSHMFTPNILARLSKRTTNKTICTYHGECLEFFGFKGAVMRMIERRLLPRTDKIISVSDHVKIYVERKLGIPIQATTIHNFAEPNERSYSFSIKGRLRFVTASNNQPYKNYPLLLDCFERLKGQNVTLEIFGSGMDSLITDANKRGLSNISFKGSVRNLTELLPDYDVYIATSSSGEGFSISLLEAMGAGLPVICSDIGPFKEAVGNSALLFRNNDLSDLVSRVRAVIDDQQLLEISAEKIKERARLFSREHFVKQIQREYYL